MYVFYFQNLLASLKVPPQIMTSYDKLANERPVYTEIDQFKNGVATKDLLYKRPTLQKTYTTKDLPMLASHWLL